MRIMVQGQESLHVGILWGHKWKEQIKTGLERASIEVFPN